MSYYCVAEEREKINRIKKGIILSVFIIVMVIIFGLMLTTVNSDLSNNNRLRMERDVPAVQRFNYNTRQFERIGTR